MVNDISANEIVKNASEALKEFEEVQPPEWAQFVKTGPHKERPPHDRDWWYMRAAAVLRSVSNLGPVGVSKLRTKYGGRKNRGVRPEKFVKASGNILRKVFQQLEQAKLIQQAKKGNHKGRVITPKGQALLAKASKKDGKKGAAGKAAK